ncbi:hypothetical protein GCM10009675_41190 [Prauserella alba]|uniref:Uncharacterized protein n=1 Tax=Prauserella alba TaxID=176898 RepID=A0ABN1VLR1_9PSEU
MPGEERLHGGAGFTDVGERPFRVGRGEAGREMKPISFPQGNLQLLAEAFDHVRARPRPARLDEAEVTRREVGGNGYVELGAAPSLPPFPHQSADRNLLDVRHTGQPAAKRGRLQLLPK